MIIDESVLHVGGPNKTSPASNSSTDRRWKLDDTVILMKAVAKVLFIYFNYFVSFF